MRATPTAPAPKPQTSPKRMDLSLTVPKKTLPMACPAIAALATMPEAAAISGRVASKEVA